MSLSLGNTTIGSLYLGSTKVGEAYLGSTKVYASGPVDPYNPLGLPPFTIRAKFNEGYTPRMGDSQTLVDANTNVWDITKNSTSWSSLFANINKLIVVLGANSTGVTNMSSMFNGCFTLDSVSIFDTGSVTDMSYMFQECSFITSVPLFDTSSVTNMSRMFKACGLTSVPLFDTSSVTNMSYMFQTCYYLTSVPLFDTGSVTDMSYMFSRCYAVESGALALYQQASTQANPPTSHADTFSDCGKDTVTGAAELARIPKSWGGMGA